MNGVFPPFGYKLKYSLGKIGLSGDFVFKLIAAFYLKEEEKIRKFVFLRTFLIIAKSQENIIKSIVNKYHKNNKLFFPI